MGVKLVLARLPIRYERWRGLGVFRHGAMLDPDYAISVFARHYERVRSSLPPAFSVLELGPGDSLATAVIAAAHGGGRSYLVDAGAFAGAQDVSPYNRLAERLSHGGLTVPGAPFSSVAQMLRDTNATYLTGGVSSLQGLAAASLDFAFSHAVLEHVRLGEFDRTVAELYRLQRPGSFSTHRIDLQDHLDHSLHSLRFSESFWEAPLVASSGFYTNRLRPAAIVQSFTRAGFSVLDRGEARWPQVPLPTSVLHGDFAAMSADELSIFSLDLLARK